MSLMLENQVYRLEEKIKDLEERLSFLEAHVVVAVIPDKPTSDKPLKNAVQLMGIHAFPADLTKQIFDCTKDHGLHNGSILYWEQAELDGAREAVVKGEIESVEAWDEFPYGLSGTLMVAMEAELERQGYNLRAPIIIKYWW